MIETNSYQDKDIHPEPKELPFPIEQKDLLVIDRVSPLVGKIVRFLQSEKVSDEQRDVLYTILQNSIFSRLSNVDLKQISTLVELGIFEGENTAEVSSVIEKMKVVTTLAISFEIALENANYEVLKTSDEFNKDPNWYASVHEKRVAMASERYNQNESLKICILALEDFINIEISEPLSDEDLEEKRKEVIQKSKTLFSEITAFDSRGQAPLRIRLSRAIDEILPQTLPLVSLLSTAYRNQLSHGLREYLVEKFDEKYQEKFFESSGGLLKDYEADMEYLKKLGINEQSYQELLKDLISHLSTHLSEGSSLSNKVKITKGIGVFPGYLDNPFGTKVVEHMKVDDQQITEIGIYIEKEEQEKYRKPDLVVSGAWEFLLDQGLYQSPEGLYSLSPRKVIPFLKNNLQHITGLLSESSIALVKSLSVA